jgi:hypothetical protein
MQTGARNLAIRFAFIFYCTAVGAYLVFRPWAPDAGDASAYFKGFISGLGFVHLLAGFSDAASVLRGTGARP